MKIKPKNQLDAYNLKTEKTQYCKSVKLRESTYNILTDIRDHNTDVKTIDDVVMKILLALAVSGKEEI